MRHLTIIALLSTLLLSSCYEDFDNSTEQNNPIVKPQIFSNTEISGLIDNGTNEELAIIIDGISYDSQEGYFSTTLDKASVQGQVVLLEKEGKLVGAVQTPLVANDKNYCTLSTISLDEQVLTQSNTITLANNDILSIDNASYIDINKTNVNGSATLSYQLLTDTDILKQLSNYVIGADGEYYTIAPSKAIVLDFKIDGQTVYANSGLSLSIDIPQGEQVYYLDESSSRWFSWSPEIDADVKYRILLVGQSAPASYVSGSVSYQEDPIKHQKLELIETFGHSFYGSISGKWANFVTTDSDLTIDLIDPCSALIQEETIDIGIDNNYTIENAAQSYLNNDFEIIDCDGEIVTDGVVQITNNELSYYIQQGIGENKSWLPICGDKGFGIAAKDNSIDAFGDPIEWATSDSEIGILSTCENHQDGFAFIQIRGDRKVYTMIELQKMTNTEIKLDNGNSLALIIEGIDREVYNVDEVNISINDNDFGDKGYRVSCLNSEQGCGIDYCEISHLLNSGDSWDRVYFEGSIWMQTIEPPTAGNFDIRGLIQSK